MTNAITVNNVSKVFGKKHALDKVALTIPKGQIFGFLGPNGAGKTTVIRCLMDYIKPTTGTIRILSHDAHLDSAKLKSLVGYLSSDIQLHLNWTVKEHIDFIGSIKGVQRANELLEKFKLDLKPKVQHLSSGNKQKLAIILAFIGKPELLIMDEPTRGLDPQLQNQLYDLLREFTVQGGTVFLSSHNLSEVQGLCDAVAVIRDGKIVVSESMNDILQLKIHVVHAVATTAINKADFQFKNTELLMLDGKSITIKAKGNIDQINKALSKYKLTDLEVSHASLEDVFLEYY